MLRSFEGTLFTTRSPILIWPAVISSSPARQRSAVVLPQPDGPTRTRNSPSLICRSRSLTATTSSEYAFVTWSKVTGAMRGPMLTGEGLCAKPLEVGHQLLALGEETPVVDEAGPDTTLDALHERRVLAADLAVEGDQLVHEALVDPRREEVVEEAGGSLRPDRQHRPAREVRLSREDVDT